MSTHEEEKRRNLEAYSRLTDEIIASYMGQYVAIADGRVSNVQFNFEEAMRLLESILTISVCQREDINDSLVKTPPGPLGAF